MKFARRSRVLLPMWTVSRRGRRPSRACRPALGMERCEERQLLSTALVSVNAAGTASGNSVSDFSTTSYSEMPLSGSGQSLPGNLSADGTKLVFVSEATNLVGSLNDTNHASDVFVRDLTTGQTSLVSATPNGQTGNGPSFDPMISPDGRYVAFLSQATNLSSVAASSTGLSESSGGYLYVRDLLTQTTTLLDQTPGGTASDGSSTGQFVFSPDSKDLAFIDTSDNLTNAPVDPESNANPNPGWGPSWQPSYVYLRDLAGQTTSLVSVSTAGQASGDNSASGPGTPTDLVFSPDSHALVFGSSATDLTADPPDNAPNPFPGLPDTNTNLFLRDLSAGTTTLLSVTTDGRLATGNSLGAVFSPDGHSVAFTSNATKLTANAADPTPPPGASSPLPGGVPTTFNVFVRDLTTGTTTLVSATPDGLMSNGNATQPVFSPDGHSLAFTSSATDLTSNPIDPTLPPGSPTVSSVASLPTPALPITTVPVSPVNLPSVPEVSNTVTPQYYGNNVFLRDLSTGTTTLVSVTPDGQLSSGSVNQVLFSPDGRSLAFISSAGDLTNNAIEATPPALPGTPPGITSPDPFSISNVFVRDLTAGTTTLASMTTGGQLPNAYASGLIFSPDSQLLFFQSNALDLTSNPPDTSSSPSFGPGFTPSNFFVRDLLAGTTSLISATAGGKLSSGSHTTAILSPDGRTLYFDSDSDNLTTIDSNGSTDIFAASAPFTVPNQIQFASWESTAQESAGRVAITVLRSGPATAAASVDYTVQDGTAQAGTDFQASSGTLKFAAGQTAQTFTVPLVAGDHFDGTRSASLLLSNPQGASLGYPSAVLDLTAGPAPTPSPAPTSPTPAPTSPTPAPTSPTPAPASPTLTAPTHTVTTSASVTQPGPTVVSVAPLKGRRGITGLVITFNQALNSGSAQNAANYQVSLPGRMVHMLRGHQTAVRPGRSVGVTAAAYDAANHQVTLTLRTKLRPRKAFQLQIKGSSGGVANAQGTALNSPNTLKPGQDYLATLDLAARHP